MWFCKTKKNLPTKANLFSTSLGLIVGKLIKSFSTKERIAHTANVTTNKILYKITQRFDKED
jgi:hypothetical protein